MNPSSPPPRVIGLVGMSLYGQDSGIVRGVAHYAQTRNWRVQLCGDSERELTELQRNFQVDGIIAHVTRDETARHLEHFGIPVVNVSGHNPMKYPFPFAVHEMDLAGQMAADYFWNRGFRHFAVEPLPMRFPEVYVSLGALGFIRKIQDYGAVVHGLQESLARTRLDPSSKQTQAFPVEHLNDLPQPAAVFVVGDRLAARIAGMCQDQGLSVPEDIALLGFGDFELVCETAYPPLSSIQTQNEEQGRQAAGLLYQMLTGATLEKREHLIPPSGIVTRRSTDALSIEDRVVAKAVGYIRSADLRDISCQMVANACGINRRTLERKFRQSLGHTLYTEIQHWRCARARTLIQTSRLPLKAVAIDAGFRDADHMGKVFKSILGQRPKDLRPS